MKRIYSLLGAGLILTQACQMKEENKLTPPDAAKKAHTLEQHGDIRTDNYYWFNDREDEEVINYLKEENAYTEAMMGHTDDLQKTLFEEIKGRIVQEDQSVPYKDNGYFYYTRTIPETEYYLICRKKDNLENEEEILLDVNELAKDLAYYEMGGADVSTNNEILAFSEDTVSRRKYTIRFKDLKTGEFLKDQIPNTTGSCVWANDNKTIFYSVKDEVTLRPEKIMRHTLGTPVEEDVVVYHETDEMFTTYITKTHSKKYLVIGSDATLTTECRVLNADNPTGDFRVIQPRIRGLEYSVNHFKDHFYIRTNYNAQNFRIVRTPEDRTDFSNWEDVIPHRQDVLVQSFVTFNKFLVVSEREEGIKKMRVYKWDDMSSYTLDFGESVYQSWFNVNNVEDTIIVRVGYSSMTTPSSTFDFNMETKEFTLLKQYNVLGDFDKENYETRRVYATARDGKVIPISMVYRKGVKPNGKNPLLLYGYGSYGYTIDPGFSISRLSLLDRGFVYAIAHIRGSETYGREWYEDGKLLNKKNTFTDFIDCGQFIIDSKWADEDNLFAMGGSAGGLLMGAVINMEPSLWKAVVAQVPFVDVVTTMLDESIPLTVGEFDEWGNPKEKLFYDYMLSYSPYDNVEEKDYPAMLVTTGLHDSQVQYFEPTKWVAKMRDMKTDSNPLLLKVNMEYGHGGASGRFQWIHETALEFAFILDQAGIKK